MKDQVILWGEEKLTMDNAKIGWEWVKATSKDVYVGSIYAAEESMVYGKIIGEKAVVAGEFIGAHAVVGYDYVEKNAPVAYEAFMKFREEYNAEKEADWLARQDDFKPGLITDEMRKEKFLELWKKVEENTKEAGVFIK